MNIRRQFLRFVLVGGLATAIQYVILIVLVQAGATEVVTASSTGFAISAIANYAFNRRFTFRSDASHALALPRFLLVALTGAGINAALVWLCNTTAGLHYLLAQALATIGTLLWNFSLNRLWTFGTINSALETRKEVVR